MRASLALLALFALAQTAVAQHPGLDPANIDTTCAPCKDFNLFANGNWMKHTQRPADQARWGSFSELADRNQTILKGVVEQLAATAPAHPKTSEQKLGAFYASCMDTAQMDRAGITPIQPALTKIAAIKTNEDAFRVIADLNKEGGAAGFFGLNGGPDIKNTQINIAQAQQGGLGLPDQAFYFRKDSTATAIREAYVSHISRMFQLLGDQPAAADTAAAHVFALETSLAKVSMSRISRRDPNANYHKMPIAEANGLTPHLEWRGFMKASGLPPVDSINIGQPSFFKGMDSIVAATPTADIKSYLRWHAIRGAAPELTTAFRNEVFRYSTALSGVSVQQPRWKQCLQAANGGLPDAVTQAFIAKAFSPEARKRARDMVENLIAALDDRLHTLEWMSDSTRQAALVKLRAYGRKIGYADKFRDYATVEIDKGPFALNAQRVAQYARNWRIEQIGKPVDHTFFSMTGPTVNANYNPTDNAITFPAGILQPPFFDPNADDAVNYGGMGAVIGHEMTHGFDDQGRQFDAHGNLRDWWTPADAAAYKTRADKVANQFDTYTVVDSTTHVQGRLVLGESIADLGGLKIAFAAWQHSWAGKAHPAPIDGYTSEQRFFLAYAQIWREVATDQYLRNQVATDVHAPAKWRIIGPLSNLPEFAAAFHCQAGDPMVRPDSLRAAIW
ncbi:MAG TPA: M13 family metallopeptidase [Gemmatimonadales bacterium]